MNAGRLLTLILRAGGALLTVAFTAVFLPTDWMADIHRWLGMGELPRGPVVEYLTRTVSALYGFHGVLYLLIARDPLRHERIVRYIGVVNILGGAMLFAIDLYAGMPPWWTFAEGPPLVGLGILVLYLINRATKS